MKKWLSILALLVLVASGFAQKLPKPKQSPSQPTAEQTKTIQQGVALHDAKKYDEAIAKYVSVLAENPDSTLALYELSLSYYNKGDRVKAKETALRGAGYISDDLALFYGILANCLDDEGKPDEAIRIYRDAEDILKSYPDMKAQMSSIHYNLGVTYFRLKNYAEAHAELKKSVEHNFAYSSPHYLLSLVYEGTKYKIPALLASARLISLESNSARTKRSAAIIVNMLTPAKDPKTGNINIFMDLNAPKDEGDFGMFDLMLGTLTSVRGEKDKKKTDNEMFIDAIGTIISMLSEDKKLGSTFVGKHYVPFMTELKKSGHVETFGNIVLYVNNNANTDAVKWLTANEAKLTAFYKWAKGYNLSSR